MLTSLLVGLHYGRDVADLRQRKVLEQAERIAEILVGSDLPGPALFDRENAFGTFFGSHPDAYGWRIFDANGVVIQSSAFDWTVIKGIPASSAQEWTHRLDESSWVAGKRFACGEAQCEVQVIAVSDPVHLFARLVLGELMIHVLLPVCLFAALMLLAMRRVTDATLGPLGRVAAHAHAIREFQDVEPIRLDDAPIEISELAGALNATLVRLQAAMDRERAFILDAAHSMRTPLAALQMRLELDGEVVDGAALRADMRELTRLCGQLLNSAHADRLVIDQNRRIDIEALVVRVLGRLDSLARAADIFLSFENHSGRSLIRADEDAISLALTNLIENAIQHAPGGSEVLVSLHDAPFRIEVSDQGPGIAHDQLDALIEPFRRGRGAQSGGAGLGLSIVRRIMQVHGGHLMMRRGQSGGLTAVLVFS